jgi:hypothetical protein
MPLLTRLWFSYLCFFAVLFDGAFAARVRRLRDGGLDLPAPGPEPEPRLPQAVDQAPALQLLGLLQREGRLVDFLQQDVETFDDADVAAAARVVHEGCRKALRSHCSIVSVRAEDEGTTITVEADYDANAVKLTGNVAGTGPYRGILRHRGWRATDFALPRAVEGHDAEILAPAEVEL